MRLRPNVLTAIMLCASVSPPAFAQSEAGTEAARRSPERRLVPIEGRFGDGWQQTITLPDNPLASGERLVLWVESGWLAARRESSHGQFDWQIVLCQIEHGIVPEIHVADGQPFLEVTYRGGRYFIRETLDMLRSVRDTAPAGELLTKEAVFGPDAKSSGYGNCPAVNLVCTAWRDRDWQVIASGTDLKKASWRAVVRLDPWDRPGGSGVSVVHAGHIHYFHGDKWLIDDGELLIANRMLPTIYDAIQKRESLRKAILSGDELPAIDATVWLNTSDEPGWGALKGKVVLVDFWGTWCGPCVAKLPAIQALHEKYAERGLVVLGIHSEQGGGQCAEFVKQRDYTFPIAVDSGKTAEAFAIESWPTYFLFDRSGKAVQAYTNSPPDEDSIETLLGKLTSD